MMAKDPEWMHRADVEILWYLEREQPDYVALVASRLGMHLEYAESRCEALAERGFIEAVSAEVVFRITDRGREVLETASDGREMRADGSARN